MGLIGGKIEYEISRCGVVNRNKSFLYCWRVVSCENEEILFCQRIRFYHPNPVSFSEIKYPLQRNVVLWCKIQNPNSMIISSGHNFVSRVHSELKGPIWFSKVKRGFTVFLAHCSWKLANVNNIIVWATNENKFSVVTERESFNKKRWWTNTDFFLIYHRITVSKIQIILSYVHNPIIIWRVRQLYQTWLLHLKFGLWSIILSDCNPVYGSNTLRACWASWNCRSALCALAISLVDVKTRFTSRTNLRWWACDTVRQTASSL